MPHAPRIDKTVFLAAGSVVEGDVEIGPGSSVWYNAVVRADLAPIRIGARTNVQAGAGLHNSTGHPVALGDGVTIGHAAIVHGCSVGDNSLVGMGSIVLDGARIGTNCILGAGSLVTKGSVIPDGSVAFGCPARVVRKVTRDDLEDLLRTSREYVRLAQAATNRPD